MKIIAFLPLLWASASINQDGQNVLIYKDSYVNSRAVIIRRQDKAVSKKEVAIEKNDKLSEEKKDTNDNEETKTKEKSKEPEPEEEQDQSEEEEDEDDPNQLSNLIKIVEPVYGTLNILNIPLGGEQKIRWEIPSKVGKTKGISVTAVLPATGGGNFLYPIAENYSLRNTSVIWNTTSYLKGKGDIPPLRANSNYRLFIHDALLKHDQVNKSRVRFASVQFNLYSPIDVSNKFGTSESILPSHNFSLFGILFFGCLLIF